MPLVIVPLAGPDFYTKEFGIRPLYQLSNRRFLIDTVLLNRPWVSSALRGDGRIIFVLRGFDIHTETMKNHIQNTYPNSAVVVMSDMSMGAPFSASAALSQIKESDGAVVIDLADIIFNTSIDVDKFFLENPSVSALAPYFYSSNKKFSYLKLVGSNVVETREKEVISSYASAGVYCFKKPQDFMEAFIFCINTPEVCKVNGSYFICPSLNGLLRLNKSVLAVEVNNPNPVGEIFH
jgi:hypothetical protein